MQNNPILETNSFMQRRLTLLLALNTVCIIIMTGCGPRETALKREDALLFAKLIESSIRKGDGSVIDETIDKSTLIKKMNLEGKPNADRFSEGIMKYVTIGKELASFLGDGDRYEMIKCYEKGGRQHLLFRLFIDKEVSVNYHDFELIKINGHTKIADMYIYITGENLSETIGNFYDIAYPESGSPSLQGSENIYLVRRLYTQGQYPEAYAAWETLPDALKSSKPFMLIKINICAHLHDDKYLNALKEYEEKFPGEKNTSMLKMSGYFARRDYSKALEAVNTLDSQINKDPFLDYYRYMCYTITGDEANEHAALLRLVKNIPDFERGYRDLIFADFAMKNVEEADSLIKVYRTKNFNQDLLDKDIESAVHGK